MCFIQRAAKTRATYLNYVQLLTTHSRGLPGPPNHRSFELKSILSARAASCLVLFTRKSNVVHCAHGSDIFCHPKALAIQGVVHCRDLVLGEWLGGFGGGRDWVVLLAGAVVDVPQRIIAQTVIECRGHPLSFLVDTALRDFLILVAYEEFVVVLFIIRKKSGSEDVRILWSSLVGGRGRTFTLS